jgi:hypothetical protein
VRRADACTSGGLDGSQGTESSRPTTPTALRATRLCNVARRTSMRPNESGGGVASGLPGETASVSGPATGIKASNLALQ